MEPVHHEPTRAGPCLAGSLYIEDTMGREMPSFLLIRRSSSEKEPSLFNSSWTPALAGVTMKGVFPVDFGWGASFRPSALCAFAPLRGIQGLV